MTERPRLQRQPLELPALAGPLADVWEALAALANAAQDLPWTVVGGQMVLLHGLEQGRAPHRVSTDIDTAVDVRAVRGAVRQLVKILEELGYASQGVSPDDRAYRFAKRIADNDDVVIGVVIDDEDPRTPAAAGDEMVVDVLVPEGLGDKADIRTVGAATAFPAPGVTQALRRTELVPISVDEQVCWIPRPNLLGAIVAKATAADVDNQDVERHFSDVVFLAGLVADPIEMRVDVGTKDRQRLKRLLSLLPRAHPAWNASTDAYTTVVLLTS
jgi:hypothetical protein